MHELSWRYGCKFDGCGGGLPGSLGTGLGRRDKCTCLCPDFNSCSGSCNGCQRHARYGTIMPQLGLTQMASAAGSGDGDWQFLWPRLTGMAKPPGDSVFVMPLAACSTMKTILPLFALGVPPARNLQAWNPRQAQGAHEAKEKRAKKQCQDCGHVWSVGLQKGLYDGGSRKQALECRVPGGPNGQRRVPAFPNTKKKTI